MKNLEKLEARSHNKVCALFAENKARFAGSEQLCSRQTHTSAQLIHSIDVFVKTILLWRVSDDNDDDGMQHTLSASNDTCIHLKQRHKRIGQTEK